MLLINSFLFCGLVCMIAQIILDNTKLTPGHVTSMFVVIGAFLDSFSFYDKIIKVVGGGALLPITSFGHKFWTLPNSWCFSQSKRIWNFRYPNGHV